MSARRFVVPCVVECEQTEASFHVFAVPEGVRLRPGDMVRVIDPPPPPAFGESSRHRRMAEITRAGPVARLLTRIEGLFSITHLYEVGFDAEEDRR